MGKQNAISTQLQIALANCPIPGYRAKNPHTSEPRKAAYRSRSRLLQAGKPRNAKLLKTARNESFPSPPANRYRCSANGLLKKVDYPGEMAVKWLQNEREKTRIQGRGWFSKSRSLKHRIREFQSARIYRRERGASKRTRGVGGGKKSATHGTRGVERETVGLGLGVGGGGEKLQSEQAARNHFIFRATMTHRCQTREPADDQGVRRATGARAGG